jgi:hypothetical protein
MKNLIAGILKNHGCKDDVNTVAQTVVDALSITDNVKIINLQIREEDIRHEAAMKVLKEKLKDIRSKCGHWSRTYHPDPSGNNDSYYSCDTCGKEI